MLEGAYRVLGLRREPRMTRFLAAQLGTSHYFDIAARRDDFGYDPQVIAPPKGCGGWASVVGKAVVTDAASTCHCALFQHALQSKALFLPCASLGLVNVATTR